MPAEHVVTDTPLPAPVLHPESEPTEDVATSTPQRLPSAGVEGASSHPGQETQCADACQNEGPTIPIELRTAEPPRWKPSMDFDQPRDLRDDDSESEEGVSRGVLVLDRPRKVLLSVPIKIRIDQLQRRKPRVDVDEPRALTDDD
jgi:hypothetical protein